MGEQYMTMAEIEKAYPNEWVLITRVKSDRYQNLLGAYVVASGPDREELYRQFEQLPNSEVAGVIHTSVRPWTVVGRIEPLGVTLFRYFLVFGLGVGASWLTFWFRG